jgi:hypothetical protein
MCIEDIDTDIGGFDYYERHSNCCYEEEHPDDLCRGPIGCRFHNHCINLILYWSLTALPAIIMFYILPNESRLFFHIYMIVFFPCLALLTCYRIPCACSLECMKCCTRCCDRCCLYINNASRIADTIAAERQQAATRDANPNVRVECIDV